MDDVLTSFGNAIRAAQLVLEGDPVMDGTRQRIPADGGKKGNLAGSYIGWQNGVRPAGSIENFLTGTKENWKYQGEEKIAPLSLEQIAEVAAERERRARELQAQYEDRALAAGRRWGRAHDMVPGETTPYLDRKQVLAVGLRREGENLLVPLRDVDGKLWSIQTIFPEKKALTPDAAPIDKVMSKGAKKAGNFHVLGEVRAGAPVLVAEGYATGATGHIATDYATVVAIDSGNLDAVVGAVKGRYPDSPILILGDDDRNGKRNVGREKAEAAAEKYQVGVVFPEFATEGKFTDFNDLHVSEGLGAVKLQVEQSLSIYLTRSETMRKQDESDRRAAATDAATGPLHELDVPLLDSKQDALTATVQAAQTAAGQVAPAQAVENAIEMVPVQEINAEWSWIEEQLLEEIKENNRIMLSAPEGTITSREAITLVADDLQLLDGIHPMEQRERALLLMHESCHAQEEYAAQFVDVAAPELQAQMAAAVQARKAELSTEEALNNKLQAGMQTEAEPAETAENAIEMVSVRGLDTEQATLDVQRMVEISANANAMTSAPEGAITPEEATILVTHDVKLLGEMTTPHLRERALWVMAESREAQPAYKTQFTRLAPPELHQLMAAAVTARTAEFRKWDVVDRALKEGTRTNAESAPAPAAVLDALDAQTRKQLEDTRERDRKAVEHSIIEARQEVDKWTGGNTIEHVAAQERKPVAPEHLNLAEQATELAADSPARPASDPSLTMIPPEVEKVYLRVGHKFYHPKNQQRVAFEDHGKQLKTAQSTGPVTMAMVQIAEARGWTEIKVSGDKVFCKEAWREAALRGIGVQGYKPTALDLADLARRTPKKDAANHVAPTLQATQHGVYINNDDAALLAAVKAAGWGAAQAPAAAPVVPSAAPAKPATAAAQGDILVAHGPARYEHNKDNPRSYFVTVADDQGKQRTIWGVRLGEAIEKSGVKPGDRISLIKKGETEVEVEANVKNDKGVVIAKKIVGATRNEWAVKAHAFATQPAEQVVQAHKDLAGVVAITAAIDQQAQADGYKPNERAYIEQRVREIATRSIASGNAPTLLYREAVQATNQPQQERMQ